MNLGLRRLAPLAIVALAGLAAPAANAAVDSNSARTVTVRYVMGDAGPVSATEQICVNVGHICFGSTFGDAITVTIDDDYLPEVGGVIGLLGQAGEPSRYMAFCGESPTIQTRMGDTLRVYLDSADVGSSLHWGGWDGGPGCKDVIVPSPGGDIAATTHPATSGQLTVKYTP